MRAEFILNESQILSKMETKSPKCKNIPKRHCTQQVQRAKIPTVVPPGQTDNWSKTFSLPKRPH